MDKIERLIWRVEMLIRGILIGVPLLGFSGLFSLCRLERLAIVLGKIGICFALDAAEIKAVKLSRNDEERQKAEEIYNNLLDDYNQLCAM